MSNQTLQSDLVFEQMKGAISKEDCIRTIKEIRLNEINSYLNFFQGGLHKNLKDISEAELDEIATAIKFFCRIEISRGHFLESKKL